MNSLLLVEDDLAVHSAPPRAMTGRNFRVFAVPVAAALDEVARGFHDLVALGLGSPRLFGPIPLPAIDQLNLIHVIIRAAWRISRSTFRMPDRVSEICRIERLSSVNLTPRSPHRGAGLKLAGPT